MSIYDSSKFDSKTFDKYAIKSQPKNQLFNYDENNNLFLPDLQDYVLTQEAKKVVDWLDDNISNFPEDLKVKWTKDSFLGGRFYLNIYIPFQAIEEINGFMVKDRIRSLVDMVGLFFMNYYRPRFQHIEHKLIAYEEFEDEEAKEFPDTMNLKITLNKRDRKVI